MEVYCFNGVVAEKKKAQKNIFLPRELVREVDALVEQLGKQKGWMVHAAGLLAFLRMNTAGRARAIGEVAAADASGTLADLVAQAVASTAGGEPKYASLVHVDLQEGSVGVSEGRAEKGQAKRPDGASGAGATSRRSRIAKRG